MQIHLKKEEKIRVKERDVLPPLHLLPRWLQMARLSWELISWEPNLDLSRGWQKLSLSSHPLLPRVCISRKLDSGARVGARTRTQAL